MASKTNKGAFQTARRAKSILTRAAPWGNEIMSVNIALKGQKH